jgi:hypothetical protein
MSTVTISDSNNSESVVDSVTSVTSVVENGREVLDVVENLVSTINNVPVPTVKEVVETQEVVEKKTIKSVAFLIDVESKALVESLGDLEEFSVSNLMKVVPRLMKHVENYKNLKGPQKRELVIKMIRHIIDITDGPGNDVVWDPILKQLVPGLIDTLIEVNDGKLKIRKKKLSLLRVFCCGAPKVDA